MKFEQTLTDDDGTEVRLQAETKSYAGDPYESVTVYRDGEVEGQVMLTEPMKEALVSLVEDLPVVGTLWKVLP